MYYPVPQARLPVPGPTVQQTSPIPPVCQPELASYEARRQASRYLVATRPLLETIVPVVTAVRTSTMIGRPGLRMVQGPKLAALTAPTVPATAPIPPISQPEARWYYRLDINRAVLWEGPDQILDGATVQQTYTFVPAQPEFRYYRPDVNRYISEGPEQMFDGATVQQTYTFFPAQPELIRFGGLQWNRFAVDTTRQLDTAAVAAPQTYLFPPNQPELIRFAVALNSFRTETGPAPQFQGATIQDWFIYPPNQPELIRFAISSNAQRTETGPAPQFQGATIQDWFIYPAGQPQFRYYPADLANRFLAGLRAQFDGATIQQSYIFPVAQPDPSRVSSFLQQSRYLIAAPPRLDGATIQQTYEFLLGQPDLARFSATQRNRFIVDAIRRTEGAGAIQPQSYEFFPGQPEMRSFLAALNAWRTFAGPAPQFTGATNQQTYTFFPGQPELARFGSLQFARFQVEAVKRFDGLVLAPQTYIFPPNQPDLVRSLLAMNQQRFAVGALPRFDGATLQQTYIFASLQPEFRYYRPDANRYIWEGPDQILDGATTQPGFIFPVSQPELIRYNLPDINRYAPTGPTKQVAGATIQAGFIFPVSNPEARWYVRPRPASTSQLIHVPPAIRVDLFTLLQPTRQYYRQPAQPPLWVVIQDPAVIARLIALNARFNQALAFAGGFSQTVGLPARFGTIALSAGFTQTLSTNARFNAAVPIKGGL